MTNKDIEMSTTRRKPSKTKVKLCATKSMPVFASTHASMKRQAERRTRTKQVHPAAELDGGCLDASKCRNFPNAELASVDNHCWNNKPMNNIGVINTAAEPYLVPITTKTPESAKTLSPKTKKVALLPRSAQTIVCESPQTLQPNWGSFVKTGKPIPPPKIVTRKESNKPVAQSKTHLLDCQVTHSEQRLSRSKRRDLAYLVVDLTKNPSTFRGRKQSFDDLDATLQLKAAREERRSLTRSNTVSVPRDQQRPRKSTDRQSPMASPTIKLDTPPNIPLPPKRRGLSKVSSVPPTMDPLAGTGRRIERMSVPSSRHSDQTDGESADSAALSDLSSDAFLSSAEFSNDSKTSHAHSKRAPSKPKPYSDYKRQRRTPPPPPVVSPSRSRPTTPTPPGYPPPKPPSPPFTKHTSTPPSFPPPPLTKHTSTPQQPTTPPVTNHPSTPPRPFSPPPSRPKSMMNEPSRERSSSLTSKRKLSDIETLTKAERTSLSAQLPRKTSSVSQLKGQPPPRPPPLNPKLKQKVKEIKQTGVLRPSQPQHAKIRPVISNPLLISSTKTIPGKPVSGPHRNLPSPPPPGSNLPTNTDNFPSPEELAADGYSPHYEEVDISVPVRPPRRKSKSIGKSSKGKLALPPKPKTDPTPRRSLSSTEEKPHLHPLTEMLRSPLTLNNVPINNRQNQTFSMRSSSSPEPSGDPEDYIEPQPHNSSDELLGDEEDETIEDYVDMGSVIVTTSEIEGVVKGAWSRDAKDDHDSDLDLPEDSYVEMHPVSGDLYEEDGPEPIYIEMDPKEFIKPPENTESLYYATKDLFFKRPDLTVEKHSKKKS